MFRVNQYNYESNYLTEEVGLLIFGIGAVVSFFIALFLFLWLIRGKKSLLKILFIVFLIIIFILIGLFCSFIFLVIKRGTLFGPFLPSPF